MGRADGCGDVGAATETDTGGIRRYTVLIAGD